MSEFARDPEAQTPYDAALGGFFDMLERNAASEVHIKAALADLLGAAAGNNVNAQTYIDNWSGRHAYDGRGIFADTQGYIDESNDAPETDDVLDKKLSLLGDVGAFLIASKHSLLENEQKEALMYRVGAFFDKRGRYYELASRFGAAVAPYVAHDIDMIEMHSERGDYESAERKTLIKRGRFVLRTVDRPPYLHGAVGRVLSSGLRRARRN